MKLFRCDNCSHMLYFENTKCGHCGRKLGYEPNTNRLVSLLDGPTVYTAPALDGAKFVYCANAAHGACNWLVPSEPGADPFCRACRHNDTVPNIDDPTDRSRWQVIERAKKRLFYSLLRLGLPLATRNEDPEHGLSFRFLSDDASTDPVMTGHEDGVITIALEEADDAAREYRRTQFNEPYRTLLGHFRHEIAHHYWDILVGGKPTLGEFRQLFGDERADYGEALKAHYQSPPENWNQTYISAYATSHPWEDFAETFAHYLHIVDTTEMATAFGLRVHPDVDSTGEMSGRLDFDPYGPVNTNELIHNWIPLTSLINNLNRAVGQSDAYPFVLTPAIIEKLDFIARLIHDAGAMQWTVPGPDGPIAISSPNEAED
ncbi:zinc-binding metallopeptidase family protein [Devosia sp.]|uniref:zinc-binding metallopeptidase family protein n=1 Tax=Devosia sp. TaxID=1871048 RepID=UPI003A9070D6